MDSANFACPGCGRSLPITAERQGQRAACPACGHAFTVPKVGAPLSSVIPSPPAPVPKKKSNMWMVAVVVFVCFLVGFALALPTPDNLRPTPVNATVPQMPDSLRNIQQPSFTIPKVYGVAPTGESETGEVAMVYFAPDGAKVYHRRADCSEMHATDRVQGIMEKDAKKDGYTACAACGK